MPGAPHLGGKTFFVWSFTLYNRHKIALQSLQFTAKKVIKIIHNLSCYRTCLNDIMKTNVLRIKQLANFETVWI